VGFIYIASKELDENDSNFPAMIRSMTKLYQYQLPNTLFTKPRLHGPAFRDFWDTGNSECSLGGER
jgi:hypothetical protein